MTERTSDGASVSRERIQVQSSRLVDKVREIIEEGNARRIIIRKDGRTVMEFPLSVGVGGAAAAIFLAPTLAAVGAFAALVSEVEVIVEHTSTELQDAPNPPPSGA